MIELWPVPCRACRLLGPQMGIALFHRSGEKQTCAHVCHQVNGVCLLFLRGCRVTVSARACVCLSAHRCVDLQKQSFRSCVSSHLSLTTVLHFQFFSRDHVSNGVACRGHMLQCSTSKFRPLATTSCHVQHRTSHGERSHTNTHYVLAHHDTHSASRTRAAAPPRC